MFAECRDVLPQPLADNDILISTGCIGYITQITLDKILAAVGNLNQLWGAVFILKMFDLSQIKKTLAKYNLVLGQLMKNNR